jgi:hypothetical protein
MRRVVAKGRVYPQSYSTDRRLGRLSLKAIAVFPFMWANADDQGRLSGEPEEVKYTCCPNIDHITKADIPEILKELEQNQLVKVYTTPRSTAIQLLDWWEVHKPQWAYPSDYSPPNGWKDRLRYHPRPDQIVTENWVPPRQWDRELGSSLGSGLGSATTPSIEERRRNSEEGIVNSEEGSIPSALGSATAAKTVTAKGERTPGSREEAEETLCEEDRGIISVWRSVKGFKMSLADASALVAGLRTEFPELDLLAESKAWAARKLSEPLTPRSRPAGQLWNWMRLARKFAAERKDAGQKGARRVAGDHKAEDFKGKW